MQIKIPKYRHHKPSGKAVVTLAGKDFYLGKYDSEESHAAYRRIIGEWVASNGSPVFGEKPSSLTMAQLALAYLKYAKQYYKDSKEYRNLVLAIKPVSELYSDLLVSRFGPTEFKACRAWWLADPSRSRQYVNTQAKRLVRVLKWAVAENMLPQANFGAIKCVEPFRRGRISAPESKPVKPVPKPVVDATIVHLSPIVADMVRFQLATGCRPGEVCTIKPSMVDKSDHVWRLELEDHKTAHRGKRRVIYVGPQAQAILRKYLDRSADSYCFSPKESEAIRRAIRTARRRTPPSCGNRVGTNLITGKRKREPGECYTPLSYARAIKYAAQKASVEDWSPNQLRHSAATEIRKQFGLEAAASILGHSEIGVTQVYAEADATLALQVAMSR